jgi:hypothetical protein
MLIKKNEEQIEMAAPMIETTAITENPKAPANVNVNAPTTSETRMQIAATTEASCSEASLFNRMTRTILAKRLPLLGGFPSGANRRSPWLELQTWQILPHDTGKFGGPTKGL